MLRVLAKGGWGFPACRQLAAAARQVACACAARCAARALEASKSGAPTVQLLAFNYMKAKLLQHTCTPRARRRSAGGCGGAAGAQQGEAQLPAPELVLAAVVRPFLREVRWAAVGGGCSLWGQPSLR